MDLRQWLTIVTYAGLLALGVVALLRLRTSPLAAPLAAFCLVCFAWNFAVWAHSVSGFWMWTFIDRTASPWTVPATMEFILVFVGLRRRLQSFAMVTYFVFGILSAVAASGFVTEWGRRAAVSPAWDNGFAVLIAIYLVVACVLLGRHLVQQPSTVEKMRTRLVIAAVVVSSVLGSIELIIHDYLIVPAELTTVLLMTVVAFGLKLFDSEVKSLVAVYAAALALIASSAYVIAFRVLARDPALIALAVFAITLCWILLLAQIARITAAHRAQLERLTVLGRLASQMAHDLKNPLAALKGAAQYLVQERACGRSIDDQQEFLGLLVSESERLSRLIERYQRLGRLETTRCKVAVNDLVKQVLNVHRLAVKTDVQTLLELESELPECALDPDLVSTAVENLLRNATEAMTDGGTLTVRTERVVEQNDEDAIAITVEDTGCGMNARELERAFDEFFSTKSTGSGLGLPLVKRVVEAHRGRLSIRSHEGRGTRIVLMFPVS